MSVDASAMSLRQAHPGKRAADWAFRVALIICLALAVGALATLLVNVFANGLPRFGPHLWRRYPSLTNPDRAGARSAIFGTLWLIIITGALAIPIGVGAAMYLEEFARKDRWYNRLIEINIQNLAAVPSIVYGILGLAFIARGPLGFGPTIRTGGIILALLVLPIVIIASREAIRAVPSSIRDGSLALGATEWQAIRRQVLPAAVPGIATGVILALSRAIGEAAPLIMIGAFTVVTFDPSGLDSRFTALPIQIFSWIERPQEAFAELAAAASIVLLVILVVMNSLAVFVRNHYQKKW
jgi:phosphate transport system permease protein